MAKIVPWTEWKPYRLFPWIEWRTVAGELDTMPGVPVDIGTVWTERRWKRATRPAKENEGHGPDER